MTMTLIETITVGSGGVASMEFTGIPGDLGKDLLVLISGQVLSGGMNIDMRLNNNTSTIYPMEKLAATEISTVGSSFNSNKFLLQAAGNPVSWGAFSNAQVYISNYAANLHKSVSVEAVNENNASTAFVEFYAGTFESTAAITSIQLLADGGNNIGQHSTASLYSIS